MIPTNEERREVARKLRELLDSYEEDYYEGDYFSCAVNRAILNGKCVSPFCSTCHKAMLDKLADLIEPQQEN